MKKTILLLILSLTLNCASWAQQDSLEARLHRPLEDYCETVAFNSQELIATFSIHQADTIRLILDHWEASCGRSEPNQRVRILLAIAEGSFIPSDYAFYYQAAHSPLYRFDRRVRITKDPSLDVKQVYQSSRFYFGHVPIDGALDQWTKQVAMELKSQQDPKSDAYLLCELFSYNSFPFWNELKKRSKNESYLRKHLYIRYDGWNSGMTFSFLGGSWILIQGKTTDFGVSPQFGVQVGFPISHLWRVDLGMLIKIWTKQNDFEVRFKNQTSTTKSMNGATVGLWFTREIALSEDFSIDPVFGAAFETLSTELEKPDSDTEDDTYNISMFNLSTGVTFRIKTNKRSNIGLNLNYHYTPLNWNKHLITELDQNALSANLIYRF